MKINEPWKPELSEKEAEIIERIKKSAPAAVQKKRREDKAKERRRKNDDELLELLGIKKKRIKTGRKDNENDRDDSRELIRGRSGGYPRLTLLRRSLPHR